MSNSNCIHLVFLFFLFFCTTSLAHHYKLRKQTSQLKSSSPPTQEFLDPTLPTILLPSGEPSCSLPLFSHDFDTTSILSPIVVAAYEPPTSCPQSWSRVVLDLSVNCTGEQRDRIAAVWLDGAEILRTSTAEPNDSGVFWRVRKDITHYSALLRRSGSLSMMLESLVDDAELTGVYHLNLSLDFYAKAKDEGLGLDGNPKLLSSRAVGSVMTNGKMPSLYDEPAHLIVPVSNNKAEKGFWFKIINESDPQSARIQIPANTYKAALEIYVSYHGSDEFWYWNPPNEYIEKNNLTTSRGNSSYREVYAMIDGRFVGSIVPFPVIFTGGINPLFWEPVVALGAFNLPSYYLDMTPFLGLLLDGNSHDLGLGVTDGISFWLLDANLHLWLDSHSSSVTAELVRYQVPKINVIRTNNFHFLNGTFQIESARKLHFSGWVNSSQGNHTTDVDHKYKVKSMVEVMNDGNYKAVHMKIKSKMDVRVRDGPKTMIAQGSYKYKCPLEIVSLAVLGQNDAYTMRTNLSHTLYQQASNVANNVVKTSSITDRQDANGWMLVADDSVLDGSADTRQVYQYRDERGFYIRQVSARGGMLLSDNTTCSINISSL